VIPGSFAFGILAGIFLVLGAGVVLGPFSKKGAYLFGMLGSLLGAVLSLLVLVFDGTFSVNLWSVTPTSTVQLTLSSFSSYFLLISSLVWLGTCLYSIRYDDDYPNGLSSLLLLTMLSMVVILVAGDGITFLIGWESMTIASFFMILEGRGGREGVRNAAFLFLAFGEGSTVFIMLAFSGLFSSVGTFDFLGPATAGVIGPVGSWIFVTALIGFGLKMGIAPFHMSEWLPIAHSSAPSNASALLSATLTLMGVYGLITVISHLAQYELWWGWLALVVGGISALLGALFASVSEHSKGLPAYSTIENNGLIVVAIGAYLLASYYHLALLADFAMIAALFHAFSHSISKASLFLINGWISKLKGSFDLNSPNTISGSAGSPARISGIFTVLSLAAAPPLAGYVSEWMILEVLFQSFRYGDITSQILGTLVGALTALAAGIILVAMTKVYGFGVLWSIDRGTGSASNVGPPGGSSIRGSLLYFAALVVGIGVAAPAIFFLASSAAAPLLQANAFNTFVTGLLGVPAYFVILSGQPFGGFSPTFTAVFMLGLLSVPFVITRFGSPWRMRRTQGWFAGTAQPVDSSQMYNSYGYSTPIRIMLRFLFRTKETVVHVGSVRRTVMLSPEEYVVELEVLDVFKRVYDGLAKWSLWLSAYVSRKVMPGKLGQYIVYIMVAFIFVLLYILATVH
jgi:hydrogenase-4 component B